MKIAQKFGVRKVFRRTHDPIWHLQLGILAVIGLQLLTNDSFLPYNKFIIMGFELALLVVLGVLTSEGYSSVSRLRRTVAIVLIAIVTAINIFSLVFLIRALFMQDISHLAGEQLLINALTIYITNIFMFALWYWEMDGGGPDRRVARLKKHDFLFPQMIHTRLADDTWQPGFVDYLYLSTTNVTNFASADTVPVSHRAKLLMMTQAIAALLTVVLVAARAIGILQ